MKFSNSSHGSQTSFKLCGMIKVFNYLNIYIYTYIYFFFNFIFCVFQYNLQVLFLNKHIVTSHNMKSKSVVSSSSGFFM